MRRHFRRFSPRSCWVTQPLCYFVLFVLLKLLFIWCFYLMWAPSEEELWFCPKHPFTIYSAHSFYLASSYKSASAKSKEYKNWIKASLHVSLSTISTPDYIFILIWATIDLLLSSRKRLSARPYSSIRTKKQALPTTEMASAAFFNPPSLFAPRQRLAAVCCWLIRKRPHR